MQIGDFVVRRPLSMEPEKCSNPRRLRGRVVYLHPNGRFHTVEFTTAGGYINRECFPGVGEEAKDGI